MGRTAGADKRMAEEYAAFRTPHLTLLDETRDAGAAPLSRSSNSYPLRRTALRYKMLDSNIVFRLEGEVAMLHQLDAARGLIAAQVWQRAARLLLGPQAPVRRWYAPIKGVEGAQFLGATLVSFDLKPLPPTARHRATMLIRRV
jgi:CRISPR-associated protein Csd1